MLPNVPFVPNVGIAAVVTLIPLPAKGPTLASVPSPWVLNALKLINRMSLFVVIVVPTLPIAVSTTVLVLPPSIFAEVVIPLIKLPPATTAHSSLWLPTLLDNTGEILPSPPANVGRSKSALTGM